MRIRHKVNVRVSNDADMKDLLFAPDDVLSEVVVDGYTHQVSGKIFVLAGETLTLTFADLGVGICKGLFLKLDQDASLTLDEGSVPIVLARSGTGAGDFAKFFIEGILSTVEIEAPAEEDVAGIYCAWGIVAEPEEEEPPAP